MSADDKELSESLGKRLVDSGPLFQKGVDKMTMLLTRVGEKVKTVTWDAIPVGAVFRYVPYDNGHIYLKTDERTDKVNTFCLDERRMCRFCDPVDDAVFEVFKTELLIYSGGHHEC